MICCCPDAEGSLQTGVGRNISGSLCGITKWFLEIQGRLKTENSVRATIGLPNKRVAYGGSFLLKGSVLFAECDLECGAAPRCCQHWRRLFVILSDKQRFTRGYKRYKETSGLMEWKIGHIFHSIFT